MKVTIMPGRIRGEIDAIPSKSHLHRLLICAALADRSTLITCRHTEAEDIYATVECLSALGAVIAQNENGFAVSPIDRSVLNSSTKVVFPCGESGSTLRFMLPIACALGIQGVFELGGRLPERPLSPLDEQLTNNGIRIWRESPHILCCDGQLQTGEYNLPGDVSSQYISGLLMALPLLGEPSDLIVSGVVESAGYIEMSLATLNLFGESLEADKSYYREDFTQRFDTRSNTLYKINGSGVFKSPGIAETEGDWSNAAFWLCAGAMPKGSVTVRGLTRESLQGDREIVNILGKMGANILWEGDTVRVRDARLYSAEIDGRAIPDLIPVLAAVASVGEGTSIVRNASRLRLKESDRILTTAKTLTALGAKMQEASDGFTIEGSYSLRGGVVDAHGDHRIAMMAGVASAACDSPVTVTGAEAVNKSYPDFWKDLKSLGKTVIIE